MERFAIFLAKKCNQTSEYIRSKGICITTEHTKKYLQFFEKIIYFLSIQEKLYMWDQLKRFR